MFAAKAKFQLNPTGEEMGVRLTHDFGKWKSHTPDCLGYKLVRGFPGSSQFNQYIKQ